MLKNNLSRKLTAALLAAILMASLIQLPKTDSYAAEKLTGKTSIEIMEMMDKGWNLGNTFDATGGKKGDIESHETSWGNPVVVKELIDGVAAAGFKTIRIPCTWAKHIAKDDNYTIEPEFLARIQEVIDWCYENDLFVILNVHHEAWVNKSTIDKDYVEIGDKLGAVWTQIAEYFKDYDQHLIFEAMNEPRAAETGHEWTGNQNCYDAINYLNQIFVDAVRSNGQGYNPERAIAIPGYAAANSAVVLRSIEIPTFNGEPVNNLMISVHCYSPYDFCLSDNQKTFSETNPSDTSDIRRTVKDMKELFIDKGIAAYLGECGATNSGDNLDARIAWFNFFGSITRDNKIPAVVWDNGAGGTAGGECHRYLNRKTGAVVYPELIEAFINGYEKLAEAESVVFDFEPVKQGSSSVVQTPKDLGFAPNSLKNQAKINHTEGAAVGFSLKVDKNIDNMTALYDVSRFFEKCIKISGYVMNENADVNIGISSSDKEVLCTMSSSADWQEFTVALKPEKGMSLFFEGTSEDTFYLDDISIELIDEDEYNKIIAGASSEEAAVSDAEGNDAEKPEALDGDKPSTVRNSGSAVTILGIVLALIAIICGVSVTVLKIKRK